MEKKFILPESILTAILRYLETRPYAEVAQGIAALTRLEELKEPGVDNGLIYPSNGLIYPNVDERPTGVPC